MTGQNKYLEEYEKYKDVVLHLGPNRYIKTTSKVIVYYLDSISEDTVTVRSANGHSSTKTIHWARKNLRPLKENEV